MAPSLRAALSSGPPVDAVSAPTANASSAAFARPWWAVRVGARPIQYAWLGYVLPALLINYFGQGALLLADPSTVENPFYLLAPEWGRYPLVILATMATIIASQAVISGAFSITQQAMQLGYTPRLAIQHTSDREMGQIYLPAINWLLLISIILLVVVALLAWASRQAVSGNPVLHWRVPLTALAGLVAGSGSRLA